MKILLQVLTTLVLQLTFLTGWSQAPKTWEIDRSHASVRFGVDHFFSEVNGSFKEFSGQINFDPEHLEKSKVMFTIQVSSISTDEKDRDEHLKSPDFFDASNYPVITFVSSRFKKVDDNKFVVIGQFTMRGVTKSIELPLTVKGRMDNPWKEGYEILGVSIQTTLNRTDYGVGTGSWAATAVVSDDVSVTINMELDSKK